MVRSDSADEEQQILAEDYDLMMEEDEDMNTGGALPVIIPEWNTNTIRGAANQGQHNNTTFHQSHHHQLLATNVAAAVAAAAANVAASQQNGVKIGGGGVGGHAPLLTNRSISQPAPLSPASIDPDKSFRIRRQIANCNERRRMQSINAGFMSLRALLPRKEGEKLSKAAILQQTADMVHQLLAEKSMRLGGDATIASLPQKKPKLEEDNIEMEQRATIRKLQASLENERNSRRLLEQQVAQLREMLQAPSSSSPIMIATTSFTSKEQRKPSIAETTALLSLNGGSPCSSLTFCGGVENGNTTPTVIRPTPLAPISVEVSSPSLSTPSPLTIAPPNIIYHQTAAATQNIPPPTTIAAQQQQLLNAVKAVVSSSLSNTGASTPVGCLPTISGLHQQPSAFVSTQPSHSQRSLQTILDAIRHLEGSAFLPPSPPPNSTASTTQTSLVR